MINLWKRAAAFAEGSDGEPLNCVEHFDSGLITLLYQDYIGGLQVQCPVAGLIEHTLGIEPTLIPWTS